MKALIQRVVRGCCYSEEYGSHPGTPILIFLVLAGCVARFPVGGIIMLIVFGPMYLFGAWERGK